mmetsp:Transcript_15759/g.37562  ORF Transcript_15759/g.37562 Transcript_15759/m.37562 type:complete len:171 (-) Transcript_15759:50-562(-)
MWRGSVARHVRFVRLAFCDKDPQCLGARKFFIKELPVLQELNPDTKFTAWTTKDVATSHLVVEPIAGPATEILVSGLSEKEILGEIEKVCTHSPAFDREWRHDPFRLFDNEFQVVPRRPFYERERAKSRSAAEIKSDEDLEAIVAKFNEQRARKKTPSTRMGVLGTSGKH